MQQFKKNKVFVRIASLFAAVSFLSNTVLPAYVRAEIPLPGPNQFVNLSNTYSFPVLKGLKFDPQDPFKMQFIIDSADQKNVSQEEARRLVNYFLAGLTIPDEQLWVNMSPYEQDKMIAPSLSETDLGRDLLSQDYILKQLSSSLTYPENESGKDFWQKTYQEVLKAAKTTKVPVNTFNKIWIVPDKAEVHEDASIGLITEASLKVMLEEDYLALKNNISDIQKQAKNLQEGVINKVNEASSRVMRETILPKINADVNSGKNFATLRQVYNSLILAVWFKEKFKESIYRYYIDKGKVKGIDIADKAAKDKIYNLYVEAFRKGIYNYIKPETDPGSGRKVKRQYFSGGFEAVHLRSDLVRARITGAEVIKNPVFLLEGKTNVVSQAESPVGNEKSKKELEEDIAWSQRRIEEIQEKTRQIEKEIESYNSIPPSPGLTTGDIIQDLRKQIGNNNAAISRLNHDISDYKKQLNSLNAKSPIRAVRTMDGLKGVAEAKKINSAIVAVDWNVSVKNGKVTDDTRIRNSIPTLKEAITDLPLQYLYLATHSGRPKGKGFEAEFSLKPMVERAKELLTAEGIAAEVVLLPYDLSEAEKKVAEVKAANTGKKVIFVLENIRFYPEEKAKDVKGREPFEKKLIGLTGASAKELIYINEAFDKSHRGAEASMELVKMIPAENRAAGISLQEQINKILEFEKGLTGRLNSIFGGAKFDKYANIGEIADRIEKTDGKLFVLGALANPLMAYQGKDVGDSLMPADAEAKDVQAALKALVDPDSVAETEEDSEGFKVVAPVDFITEGQIIMPQGRPPMKVLAKGMRQVDIGPETIEILKKFFASLKPGDGIILNGGAGMFEDPRYREGTKQMILLAEEAANRGVTVFAAGGDMNAAIKTIEGDLGRPVTDKIIRSTGGGVLLEALAKGLMALPALSNLVASGADKEAVSPDVVIPAFVKEALPGAVILPYNIAVPKDTSTPEGNREPALDLRKGKDSELKIEIPQAENPEELVYQSWGAVPVKIPAAQISRALKIRIGKKGTDEKNVSAQVIGYLQEKANKVGLPVADKQERSNKVADQGDFVLDITSIIAVLTPKGDLMMEIPYWAKDEKALESFKQFFAKENELTELPAGWDKSARITNNAEAMDFLARNYARFFEELSKGNLGAVKLLTQIINTLRPEDLLEHVIGGIQYDPVLGTFISEKDAESAEKFMGKNLEAFLSKLFAIEELANRVYFLTVPSYEKALGKGVAVANADLQKAAIDFYYHLYNSLDELAAMHFGNAQVFEPLRRQIGILANSLNKAVAAPEAIDVNNTSAGALIAGLKQHGVGLTDNEINALEAIYSAYEGETIWYDILQLAEVLHEENFTKAFDLLKVGAPRTIRPEDKPYEAYDGTGRIARIALAFRLVADINGQETSPAYKGRYFIRSRKLNGSTKEEKFAHALKTLKEEMLDDDMIKASNLIIQREGKNLNFSQLISEGRIGFKAQENVLAAKEDFVQQTPVESVYPVSILFDGKEIGVAYFLDTQEFTEGLRNSGVNVYNIPRPFIVSDAGQDVYFGVMIDATPGGVETVGLTEKDATEKGIKVSGPTAFEMVGIDKIEVPGYKLDAGSELEALRRLSSQVQEKRLAPGKTFMYLKAQIGKLLLPLGGGINLSGAFAYKLPLMQDSGFRYVSPTSCSTNGGTYINRYMSILDSATEPSNSDARETYHMYTSGDKKATFGHLNPKSTGAAKGVKQHLPLKNAIYTAVRTPTGVKNGQVDIVGGSAFTGLVDLAYPVKKKVLINFLERVSSEFPEFLRVFNKDSMKDGAYKWKDTITGQTTGSIVYPDLIMQVDETTFKIPNAYDNEASYSTQMNMLKEATYLLSKRQEDKVKRIQAIAQALAQVKLNEIIATASLETIKSMVAELEPIVLNDLRELLLAEADKAADQIRNEEEPYELHDWYYGLEAKLRNAVDIVENVIDARNKNVDERASSSAIAANIPELMQNLKDSIQFNAKANTFDVVNEDILRNRDVDYLAREAAFNPSQDIKKAASRILMEVGEKIGINSSSMHGIYEARKTGKILKKITVPANNIRGMSFDTMKTGFDVMKQNNGIAIFEIARSEIDYTKQPLYEYSAQVYAAAIKAGYKGKIFIQLDHAQYKKEKYFGFAGKKADPEGARQDIVKLIDEAINARVFNIDVDPSSLMIAGNLKKQDATNQELKDLGVYDLEELSKEDALEHLTDAEILLRQTFNIRETAYLVQYIRNKEKQLGLPLTIAIGGEDMHVDQNVLSTRKSVQLFAGELEKTLDKMGIEKGKGIIKISVQSGTGHGGITIAGVPGDKGAVKIDMKTLKEITAAAEAGELGSTIAGVVQHGASTVPEEYFSEFANHDVIEVHLATGFQNKQLDAIRKQNPSFFQKLNESMVKSSLWMKDGKPDEIQKAIAKYIAAYYKKAYGVKEMPEDLYQQLLGNAIEIVESQTDWTGFTERVHQEVAGLEQFGGKIQKDNAMIMRFAIAEAFYRSYKKIFGLEKEALWGMDEDTKKAVYKSVADNFTFIWTNLGFKDTLEQIDVYASKVPIDATLRPQALQEAVMASSTLKPNEGDFIISGITPSHTTTLGSPTVRLDMKLAGGGIGYFTVPAGTSTGEDEAKTVGVEKAIENLSKIKARAAEKGISAEQVVEIGKMMLDMGKDELGAEATLSFQMASAWAAANQNGLENYEFLRELAPDIASKGVPKTKIQYNITNGGEHADNSLDMQEFMIVPTGKDTAEENKMCDRVDRQLGLIYKALGLKADPDDKGVGKLRGKEGGYKVEDLTIEKLQEIYRNAGQYSIQNLDLAALSREGIDVHEFVLNCLIAAIKNSGYTPSTSKEAGTVALALDPATTSMLVKGRDNMYHYEGSEVTSETLISTYDKWTKKYPIDSIEDGLGENDWDGWIKLIKAVGDKVKLIGDDNLVTQGGRLTKLINLLKENGLVNEQGKVTKNLGILIKLNQNGFLTTGINNPGEGYLGTLEVIRLARQYGIDAVISHRSKEAEPKDKEVSIADLAAAVGAYALKSGDHVQAIRAIKEDRLAEITAREAQKMAASSIDTKKGGIDLGGINVKAAPGSVPVNMPQIDLENFQGFSFQIIKMQAVPNFQVLIGAGLAEKKEAGEAQLALAR